MKRPRGDYHVRDDGLLYADDPSPGAAGADPDAIRAAAQWVRQQSDLDAVTALSILAQLRTDYLAAVAARHRPGPRSA